MSKIQLPKHRLLWLLVIVAGLVCADPAEPVTEPETENAPEPLEVSETLEASEQPVVQSETSEKVFNKNQKYTLAELKDMYNADLPSNPPAFLNTYAWELLLTGEPSYQHSAYNIFTYLAESYGLPSAQHGLAFMYMNGIGINSLEETASEDELEITDNQKAVLNQAQSLSKAIVYQTFASLGGDELAQQTLAYQHLTGHGMKKDCEKALIYYEKSAKSIYEREQAHILYTLSNRHQDVLSKYQIKISDYDDPSIETNAEIDEKAISAERLNFVEMRAIDNPEELVSIGQYYMNGISGVTRNLKKAEEYFLQIHKSHKSYAMAQAFLGKIYIDGGDGIEPDYKKAKEFLDQALMHKSAIAKAYYGTLYLYGWGVEKNLDKAKTFFEDSSKAGWYEASLQLGLNYYNGIFTTNTGATNQVHALKHFKKAAQFGSVIG